MGKFNRANRPGLTKNFRPQVRLKKDSACSLKRHYRGALREFVGICDLLASRDPERFIYASFPVITKHCTNYRTRKRYSVRIVKYCKRTLRAQGLISGQIERVRNGVKREGFIMYAHDAITSRVDRDCVFHAEIAPIVAPQIAPVVAPTVAPEIAPQNGKSCTNGCTGGCTCQVEQQADESVACTDNDKVLPEVLHQFGHSYPSSLESLEPRSLGSPQRGGCVPIPNSRTEARAGNRRNGNNLDVPVGSVPQIPAREILTNGFSALSGYAEQCRPFEALLIAAAEKHGVPGSWAAAVTILDEVPELVVLRDEIALRIPHPQSA